MLSIGALGPCRFSRTFSSPAVRLAGLHYRTIGRSFCAASPALSLSNSAEEITLRNVTIVSDPHDAVDALTKLIKLGPQTHTAWSCNFAPDANGSGTNNCLTLSAFAGKGVDFGNGPHLFIRAMMPSEEQKVWKVLKNYFEDDYCTKVWFDYLSVERLFSSRGIRPAGFAADLVSMASLTSENVKGDTLDDIARTFLTAKEISTGKNMLNPKSAFMTGNGSRSEAQSIARSCADAALTHTVFAKLRERLQEMTINGMNSTADFQGEFRDLLEVYQYFYVPLMKRLYEMHHHGLRVSKDMLKARESDIQEEKHVLEERFVKWACEFSPDAAAMDIRCAKQLRQLLFAPCTNIHVKTDILPEESSFASKRIASTTDRDNGNTLNVPLVAREKKFVLRGRGAEAKVHTKKGWPSVSVAALRKAAGFPRAAKATFGQKDHAFCYAVDDLLVSKSMTGGTSSDLARPTEGAIDDDNRLRVTYRMDAKRGRLQAALGEQELHSVQKAIVAGDENTLLMGKLKDMELSMLGHLSGCDSLRARLEHGDNKQELSMVELYENVKEAIHEGRCVYDGRRRRNHLGVAVPTIREAFPAEYSQSMLLDIGMTRGGSRREVTRLLGIKSREAQRLMTRWYAAHPGVKAWRERNLECAKHEGFMETISGRRRNTRNLTNTTWAARDAACAAAIGFAVNGSCGEAMMGALVNFAEEEALTNLGWRVVFVHENYVVLEGPRYAVDVAKPVVERVLREPLDFELDVMFEVEVEEGASMEEIEKKEFSHSGKEGKDSSSSIICSGWLS